LKTLIQLLIVGLVLHACFRGAQASWRYYSFRDAVEQEARFGANTSTGELQRRILDIAAEHDIDLVAEDVEVTRQGLNTSVAAAYYDSIELVPRFYTREQLFEFELNVHPVRPLTADDFK
jgi:hypothetical protein